MSETPPRPETVTGALFAHILRENIRSLAATAGEDTKTAIEIGPDGLSLHMLDMSDWIHPTDVTIGPLPLTETPASPATIAIDVRDIALWAEHHGNDFRNDLIRLTVEPGGDGGRRDALTCHSPVDETTLQLYGECGWRQFRPSRTPEIDTKAGPRADTQLAMPTKCLIKLLSRSIDMVPAGVDADLKTIRLRTTVSPIEEDEDLQVAFSGRYAYLVQTKRLKARGAGNATMFIPSTTARTFIELAHGRRNLYLGDSIITPESLEARPPTQLGGTEAIDTRIFLRWESTQRLEDGFPDLDSLRMSQADTPAITLHLDTGETARALGLICQIIESRKTTRPKADSSHDEFMTWDFKNEEVRALNNQMRIPLSRLCMVHDQPEYRDAPPLELHAGRLRRMIHFWMRHHGPVPEAAQYLPIEYLTKAQRIRVARTGPRGRMTETALQCAVRH